jgi:murein DD-endopeptidase MepM/ murein hydrolase activator NlpD
MKSSEERATMTTSWRTRTTRRLMGVVGAFGFAGVTLMLADCQPPPSGGPQPALQAKPVEAPCHYRDTFGAPRDGGARVHLGVDIIADEGQDLYAVVPGTITKIWVASQEPRVGNGVRITMPDGTYFFYGHMQRVAPGIQVGTQVTAGQLLGWVGETGNAGIPHLHLEIHPQGGAAVNPTPYVDHYGAC